MFGQTMTYGQRPSRMLGAVALSASLVTAGCAKRVMVPPRIDLTQHEVIGIMEFVTANPGTLGSYTTQRFTEAIREDQGLIRIVELGAESDVLERLGRASFDPAAYRDLGERYNLRTIVRGRLDVSNIKPSVQIGNLRNMGVEASVDATLTAQMIETATGASVWNTTNQATRTVGFVQILDRGGVAFDADDPERAYGKLVDALVSEASAAFRVTWR
jgi:hypothetical protein